MSHTKGNDMITEDSNQDKGHSESPILPPNTGDTDIDDLLTKIVGATTMFVKYDHKESGVSVEKYIAQIQAAITKNQQEIEKAYGGCHKCYGKGYATVRDGQVAYADFYGDKTRKTPITNKMKYCTCERGKQLETLTVKKLNGNRYDPERLGTYVFVGDLDRVKNLDDLYWSYVIEFMARNSASYDHYTLEYCKNNMENAGFDKVGIHKMLARADQRAKERIAELQATKEKLG